MFFGLICFFVSGLIVGLYADQIFLLSGASIFGLSLLLSALLSIGLSSIEVENKTFANQGIQSSRKNSFKIGLIVGLSSWLIAGLIVGSSEGMDTGLIRGLLIGLTCGVFFMISNGGATCIQHFNLRRILCRKGHIPWNYARFLDYASECLLMKKVGGGYVFYHRMLMEHFAKMEAEE